MRPLSLPAQAAIDSPGPRLTSTRTSVELAATSDACRIVVNTSAHGFRDIWEAVLKDFARRHSVGGLSLSINDAGATPAVVSLRLDQAFETCRGELA